MSKYTIYCTPEQTKKAFKFHAPMIRLYGWNESTDGNLKELLTKNRQAELFRLKSGTIICGFCPTTGDMIGWLEEQGFEFETGKCYATVDYKDKGCLGMYSDTREKATLSAIDTALEYLSKKGK